VPTKAKKTVVKTPAVRKQLTDWVAAGVYTYTHELTRRLFDDFQDPASQDCVVDGLAAAIIRYQETTGRPIAQALALALIDHKEQSK
jgi:hypothetical protein